MSDQVRYSSVLIGLGAIGVGYDSNLSSVYVYTHARALSTHPSFILSGACDPSQERRNLFSELYNVPTFTESSEMLGTVRPDVVVIAGPTDTHFSTLCVVLNHSTPKLILCEKPLSYSIEQAREMVRLCSERGIPLLVNYPRRSDPGVLEVAARMRSEEFKGPFKGVVWYCKGIFNNGSHLINLLELWLGEFVGGSLLSQGRCYGNEDPEPDMMIEFQRGKVVMLATREEDYFHYSLELISPSGRLRYERGGEIITWEAAIPDEQFPASRKLADIPEVIRNGRDRYQWHVFDQIAQFLGGGAAAVCDGKQGLQTLECINSLLQKKP